MERQPWERPWRGWPAIPRPEADASLFGNQAVLDLARDVCEQVCPGINMEWAWKELDFAVKTKDTREFLYNISIPENFRFGGQNTEAAKEHLHSPSPHTEVRGPPLRPPWTS